MRHQHGSPAESRTDRASSSDRLLVPSDLGFGVLFRVLPDALLLIERASERVALLSPAAERMFGLSSGEAAGLCLDHLLPDQTLTSLAAADSPLLEGLAVRPDGRRLPVEISVAPLEGQADAYLVLVVRDISLRVAAEAKDRQHELQRAEVERLAHIGSWTWDLASNRVTWSDELYRIAGQEPDRYTPSYEGYLQIIHESYQSHVQSVIERALADGEPFTYYTRIVRPDGLVRTLHCRGRVRRGPDGRPFQVVGTIQDVTEPLRLEAALRESEARLGAIVHNASDGIWIKDLQGRYLLINAAGAAISGNTVETALGRTDADLYDPETARRITAIDERILATGQGEAYEITVATPLGPRTYFSIKYPYVREESIQGIVVITRDITERNRLEAAFHEQYEQLKQLDRLKNDFVNAVSHELRTPLTSIRGYLEFMEDGIGGELSPQHAEFVGEIDRAALRLTRLVDDLLDFARIQAGTFELRSEPIDLAHKIQKMVSSLVPQAEKGHVVLEVTAEGALPMLGDPQRLGQVLLNLAGNAIKFTPPGGHVTVCGFREGDRLRVEVRDTGPGIALEDLPRLFQKFSQLSAGKQKGGSGLGLSICKAIVEGHGGEIGVESRPGEGCVFWFTLPAAPDA